MNRLDKNIKHKLDHMTVPVADHNWDKIAKRLDGHDANRPSFWPYATAVSIVLVATISALFLFNRTVETSTVKDKQTASVSSPLKPLCLDQVIDNADQNDISASSQNSSELETNPLDIDTNNSNSTAATQIDSSLVNNSTKVIALNPIASNDLINLDIQNQSSNAIKSNQTIGVELRNFEDIDPLDNQGSIALTTLNQLELPAQFIKSSSKIKKSLANTKVKKEQKGCPFGIEGNSRSIDFYMSHDLADKKYSTDDASLLSIADMRKNSETPMYSFSLGARFGYNVSYRWNMHTGINFSQVNDKFSYIDPESNQERQITIKDYITENGVIVDSIVTIETVVIPGTVKIEKMNKFRSLDIPVIGRYTILANKNLSLSATIGAYFNLTHTSSGTVVDINGKPSDIAENKINKTQLGVSSYTGLSLAYHLAGDLDFVLEPHARIYFDEINRDSNPIIQRQNIYGISTGVRYKF